MTDININQFSESINNKADRDLGNLASPEGENRFINPTLTNSSYTTNRILEIPQNIKLELNSGTLTLKAGSKVYIPNGVGIFDEIVLSSDITVSSQTNDTRLYYFDSNGGYHRLPKNYFFSGPTVPTLFDQYGVWYDTVNNVVKATNNGGSTWTSGHSLPAFVATGNGSSVTSIDQIFNGFGYIGSTVFALPMKGEATTAINQNGTVTKTIWESTTVQTLTVSASGSVSMSSAGVLTSGFSEAGYTKLADVTYYSSRIQDVDFYDIAFVANSNMSNVSNVGRSYLSGLSAPSSKYEEWTLGASGATYTAPANGWLTIRKHGTSGQLIVMENTTGGGVTYMSCLSLEVDCRVSCPAKKGDIIQVWHNTSGTTYFFRFVYAEGEV